jgi:hypothetical protein
VKIASALLIAPYSTIIHNEQRVALLAVNRYDKRIGAVFVFYGHSSF